VRVLLVDDDQALVQSLAIGLRTHGHDVLVARDGRTAIDAAREDAPDLVVLDLGLPDVSGPDVIRAIRSWTGLPIVVLSARSDSRDKVEALDLGADDYVTKPFGLEELLARIRAAGRRTGADRPEVRAGDLVISTATRRATKAGQAVRLTPTEWSLLEVLLRAAPRLVAREDLLREVWGPGYERETHYLRVHVGSLRKKLEHDPSQPRHLLTEAGMGYRFQA
jgi:two-component system KDP operon response regulator KdpE